jgi:hypothetical protein
MGKRRYSAPRRSKHKQQAALVQNACQHFFPGMFFLRGPGRRFYPLYSLAAQHAGLFKVGSSFLATWPKNVLWI